MRTVVAFLSWFVATADGFRVDTVASKVRVNSAVGNVTVPSSHLNADVLSCESALTLEAGVQHVSCSANNPTQPADRIIFTVMIPQECAFDNKSYSSPACGVVLDIPGLNNTAADENVEDGFGAQAAANFLIVIQPQAPVDYADSPLPPSSLIIDSANNVQQDKLIGLTGNSGMFNNYFIRKMNVVDAGPFVPASWPVPGQEMSAHEFVAQAQAAGRDVEVTVVAG
jgi:hypothetical protein